jgi:hypothetical protein
MNTRGLVEVIALNIGLTMVSWGVLGDWPRGAGGGAFVSKLVTRVALLCYTGPAVEYKWAGGGDRTEHRTHYGELGCAGGAVTQTSTTARGLYVLVCERRCGTNSYLRVSGWVQAWSLWPVGVTVHFPPARENDCRC